MRRTSSNNISVCFLSHSSGIAGAEKAFPKLLEGLLENGIKVFVLLPDYGPIEKVLKDKNIHYDIVKYSRWINSDSKLLKIVKRSIRNLIMVVPIMVKIRKQKCNIVYTNTSTICSGALASKLLKLPHIWHFREFGSEDYGYTYDLGKTFSQWLTNKLSTICLTNSAAVRDKYSKFIPEKKLKVLYESYKESEPTIAAENKITINKSSFNCIIVGTLHEAKGHRDAIKALKNLLSQNYEVKLFILGTGDENYKNELLGLIDNLKIEKNVEFLGYVEYPKEIMQQCDVLLMCSRNEAFGLVTLEAMKTGIPVIGTNSGGTKELIKDNLTGFLYNSGDFNELSEKIKYFYNNREKLGELGNNAKKWSEDNFSYLQYIQETIQVIEQIYPKKI